jgi:hypothetical protein
VHARLVEFGALDSDTAQPAARHASLFVVAGGRAVGFVARVRASGAGVPYAFANLWVKVLQSELFLVLWGKYVDAQSTW